jgi:hypothetical protein
LSAKGVFCGGLTKKNMKLNKQNVNQVQKVWRHTFVNFWLWFYFLVENINVIWRKFNVNQQKVRCKSVFSCKILLKVYILYAGDLKNSTIKSCWTFSSFFSECCKSKGKQKKKREFNNWLFLLWFHFLSSFRNVMVEICWRHE